MIFPEKNHELTVSVSALDNNGNMIAYIEDNEHFYKEYFINFSEGIKAYIVDGSDIVLRNNFPIQTKCLPGELKKDMHGDFYYAPGLWIRKLLPEGYPYFDVGSNDTRINDQNSNGFVVGRINTFYPGFHAFLAIP